MSGFKSTALVISEKATPVTPTETGDISVVAREGKLFQYDGASEKQLLTEADISGSSGDYVLKTGDTMTGGLVSPFLYAESSIGVGNYF